MRSSSTLVAFVSVAAAACGSSGGAYTVSGVVSTPTLQGTAAGVAGVTVRLQTVAPPSPHPVIITELATTDAKGRFAISAIPGRYSVTPILNGFVFVPDKIPLILGPANVDHQDFLGLDTSLNYAVGEVIGVARAGVAVDLQGPVSASTSTNASGAWLAGPLPTGTYTVSARAPSLSIFPGSVSIDLLSFLYLVTFLATPPVTPATVAISGDAASGIAGGTFTSIVPVNVIDSSFLDGPQPGIALYYPAADHWTFSMFFNPGPGAALGGHVLFPGRPAVGAYTKAQQSQAPSISSFGECWRQPGAPDAVGWYQSDYTLTLTSAGEGVPATLLSTGHPIDMVDYPIHGTLHIDCAGSSPYSNLPPPPGNVMVDVTF